MFCCIFSAIFIFPCKSFILLLISNISFSTSTTSITSFLYATKVSNDISSSNNIFLNISCFFCISKEYL